MRVGAVVGKGHRTFAVDHNIAGPPNTPYHAGHAERRVLRYAKKKSTLYVARLDLNHGIVPSHPCNACMVAIELNRKISNLVWWDGIKLRKDRI